MSAKAYHLNLLKASERVSSSPVRIRVMLPVLAMFAVAGAVVWWGSLLGRVLLARASAQTLQTEIDTRKAAYADVMEKMNLANELESELEQLEYYRAGRNAYGGVLTSLAEVMPLKIQLTRLEIPQPPPQSLVPPGVLPGRPYTPLWGPTGNVESVSLVLAGRTPKETPIVTLMESLESDAFTNLVTIVKDPRRSDQSPKVRSIRQDTSRRGEGSRMLAFEIEYRVKDRRFAK